MSGHITVLLRILTEHNLKTSRVAMYNWNHKDRYIEDVLYVHLLKFAQDVNEC